MPKYIIERTVPGAGQWTEDEVREISAKSNEVLDDMPEVQWQESYVVDDKLYCVYVAPDQDRVIEHARRGGFPADKVSEVRRIIDPTSSGR
ncbi:hypothetical protein Mycch_5896 (plasmid) [Mycolicibacterium chubuense NBB4]|uniref:DUF4242 domain-containing protein n=2 Tax=Mycolicibacterium TaxID=1866885 RepID=D2K2D3_MYCCN|nr:MULTISPECIES: DUF4242 domain-containing protein [Mycolicibacterium]ACZ56339.1 conserved hypothetical protein [Mycolicibacterium chubuense NBB4]AFM20505.1 hypothetical protein Mycch_5896 [Mycolicibacterium chubuense NBB4]NTY63973.1 DUF4242 domain-containing protein [Mycolicibacterium sphagni]